MNYFLISTLCLHLTIHSGRKQCIGFIFIALVTNEYFPFGSSTFFRSFFQLASQLSQYIHFLFFKWLYMIDT